MLHLVASCIKRNKELTKKQKNRKIKFDKNETIYLLLSFYFGFA